MAKEITGRTGLICLLGSPVSHSISPSMHNAAFQALSLDYAYLAFDVGAETLEDTVKTLKNIGARGWNLTMPNKSLMAKLCDRLSPAAQISGSVNTVVHENGILTGHTTDGLGFLRSAKEEGCDVAGKKVTLLGAGGASTSILAQAALDGASEISVFSRKGAHFQHAMQMIEALKQQASCKIALYDLADKELLKKELQSSFLLVNGTSVGMAPDLGSSLIPSPSWLPPELAVADTIYNPRETRLLSIAKEAGCHVFNGMYMLLYQGAEAFRLWTGKEMPVELIKKTYFS